MTAGSPLPGQGYSPRRSGPGGAVALVLVLLGATPAHAQYIERFEQITNGAVTFIGNTLGLSKQPGQNNAGTADSIGAFSTTNTALQVGNYPAGTTLNYLQNSSTATLSLPAGSTVLYAELTWAGSYSYGGQDVSSHLNDPITLTTPKGTFNITRDPAFLRTLGSPQGGGFCSSATGQQCFYARTANVTSQVRAGGNGVYAAGAVPGTAQASEDHSNCAGWTLAVVYQNFSLPVRDLTVFVGSEVASNSRPPASASGFCTPPSGTLSGRLAISAMEGDATISGDTMLFGPTSSLGTANRLVGPNNNPINNFFASQINRDDGTLDTSGTFGTRNANPFTASNISGGRQGWDITNVDVSSQLQNGQTQAFAQGTTTGDDYMITDLGLQIDVSAPAFDVNIKTVDKIQAVVGDTLTYTIRLHNSGIISATNVVFTDPPPAGTTFVAGSVTIDGVTQPSANPTTGFSLGTIAGGVTRTVVFKVQVATVPASPAAAEYDNAASWTYQYVSCAGQPTQNGTFTTNTVTTRIARIEPAKAVSPTAAVPNQTLTYTVTIPNTGTANATSVTLTDAIPAGTSYVAGSTTLNGVAVPDKSGPTMPFAQGGMVNSPGEPTGQVNAGEAATVQFQVRVNASTTGTVTNTALIDPDGPGPQSPISRSVDVPVTPQADMAVTKTGPAKATAGTNLVFTITVTNQGPSSAANVVLNDATPQGLTFVSNAGDCTSLFPCSFGTLASGATRTVTATYFVPPGYTTPDPIVNLSTVSSPTPDPAPGNNTAQAAVSLNAPVAALAVTKSNGVATVVAGTPTTYTITVQNMGPSAVPGVHVTDPLPAELTNATWTCSASGGGSCAVASGTGSIDTTVTLPVNAVATFLLTATVRQDATGLLHNTVTAQNPPNFGNPSSATATDTDAIIAQADVSVTKTGPTTAVVPGNTVAYTIVARNSGPSPATGVVVEDPGPPGLTFVSNAGDCTTAFPCALGTLAPGASRTITATFLVPFRYTTPNPIVNTTTVSSATPDPNQGNNTATAQTPVNINADVAVSKVALPTSLLVGETVTLFIDVLNNGPNRASGVVVTDVLPAGLSFVSASPQQGTYVASSGQWFVGTLDNGGTAELAIMAEVTQAGTISNIATKTAANEPDPNTSNDTAAASINAAAAADIAVQKAVDRSTPAVGESVTFTVTVTNQGPSDATGVVLQDTLPAGLTLTSSTPSQGTYVPGTGTWTVGDVALDGSATLTLVASVNTTGMLVNTARKIAQVETDPNPANDQSSVSLNATTLADIQVTKAISNPAPAVGEQVTFTVTATNLGPSPATGVVLTDQLPAGVAFVSATPSQGTYVSATGVWEVGSMAATQSAVLSITARVTQPGTFTNTATKTAANEPDPNPTNDSGSASGTASLVADLAITKAAGLPAAIAGGTVDYAITVTNNGPSDVTGAAVADAFPAPVLTGVTWSCMSAGGACGAASGAGDIMTTVDLPAGASAVFAVTGSVAADATGTLVNTATVTPPSGTTDPNLANNTATASTPILALADVAVTKVGPQKVVAGNTLAFTIEVTNNGPSVATNVTVDDMTPPGLTFVSNTGDCTTPFQCSLGTMAPNTSRTITSTFMVPAGYTTPDPIVNVVTAMSQTVDPAPVNNTAEAAVSLNAPVAALAVTKSDAKTQVIAGTTTVYTITVSNPGPSAVTGVHVTDPLPAELVNGSWTCVGSGGGSCTAATGTGSIDTTVALPVGAVATFELTATVSQDAQGLVSNTVTAQNPPNFGSPSSASATDTNEVIRRADLSITKSGPTEPVVPGHTAVYTIVVTNGGPSAATDVTVADPTPMGLTFVSNSGGCTTPFPCDLGMLATGASQTITTTYLVPPGYTTPNPIVETAIVSSPVPDPTPDNNSATVMTPVDTNADVEVTKFVAPTSGILVGDTVTFTVVTRNHGPNSATGVVITDILPAGLTLTSASPSQGTYSPATGEWVVPSLALDQEEELVLQTLVTLPGDLTNLAVRTGGNEPDPNPGNDSGAATINAAAAADVALQKTVDRSQPSVGETVTFTVTATNRGPSSATGVFVEDTLPPGLTLVTATPSQGTTYDEGTGGWTIGDLALSASATLTLVASVDTTGVLVNEARKTAQTEVDPNPLNDVAEAEINAIATADIGVGKAISTRAPAVGGDVSFTVTATNFGPSPATGVVITDPLPAGLTFVSAMPSQGTYDQASGVWTVGDLAATRTALLSVTARVTQVGPFTNTATRTASNEPDPNPDNDSASVSAVARLVADLSITKTDGQTTAFPGQVLTYTITVHNAGPSPVVGAAVTDTFPAQLGPVTWTCAATAGGSCGAASGSAPIATTVDLPAGADATFLATGTVNPAATGIVTNTASVRTPEGTSDPDPTNNDDTDVTILTPSANLSITKSGPASAIAGANVVYTLVVTNAGPSIANDVSVTDPTPPGLVFLSNAGDCTTPFPCALGDLGPGESRTIMATFTVVPGSMLVLNTATVASPTPDPNLDDNTAEATLAVVPTADLAVTKTGPATATADTTATYTIGVTNNGPNPALAAVLTDTVPAGAELVSATASQGGCTGTTPVTCTLGALTSGQSVTVSVTVHILPSATGKLVDTATVSSPTPDPMLSNNSAMATTTVTAQADLALTKAVSPTHVDVGQAFTYTLTVTNRGPSPATGVTVTDALPAGVTVATVVASQGSCALAGATVTCALGTVAANAAATVTITATREVPEPISNTASVTGTEPDPVTDDNTATVTLPGVSGEICDNCKDDDGDGLVDNEDPDCCTAQGLTVNQARYRPGRTTLHVNATLADGTFPGFDPREQDLRLQVRGQGGELVCCTLPHEQWQKLFRRSFGFFDQHLTICPPIKCVKLAFPKNGPPRVTVIAGGVQPGGSLLSPVEITLSAGGQCTTGSLSLRPKGKHGAVFP